MEKRLVLVVSEGVSDFEVLKIMISKIGELIGIRFEFELISPAEDETTRVRERGGWGNVRAWCRVNGCCFNDANDFTDQDRLSLRQAGLFPDFIPRREARPRWPIHLAMVGASCLIVHLDADIAEKISDQDKSFVDTGLGKKDYCRNVLQTWLGSPENRELLYVIAAQCVESWFLAMYDKRTNPDCFSSEKVNYEEIDDVVERLIRIGYDVFSNGENGHSTVDKILLTEKFGDRLRENYELIESRCPEVKRIKTEISNRFLSR